MGRALTLTLALVTLAGCSAPVATPSPSTSTPARSAPATAAPATTSPSGPRTAPDGRPFVVEEIGDFDEPWAMTFLPDGRPLITGGAVSSSACAAPTGGRRGRRRAGGRARRPGRARRRHRASPDFASTGHVYLSWAEAGDGGCAARRWRGPRCLGRGARPARRSDRDLAAAAEGDRQRSLRSPLAFSPDGAHLFVSSGERQKIDPAQDMNANLGKIVRLDPDGTPAAGQPVRRSGRVAAEVWTLRSPQPARARLRPGRQPVELRDGSAGRRRAQPGRGGRATTAGRRCPTAPTTAAATSPITAPATASSARRRPGTRASRRAA